MRWVINLIRRIWQIVTTPAVTLSIGFLTLGGFIGGVIFWGAFNTALEVTNTEKFCTSCHEMRNNVYEELSHTIHFSNRSGVRASCPDCHVPHEWSDKIARKMQASKEVWGAIEACDQAYVATNSEVFLDCIHDDFSGWLYTEPVPRGTDYASVIESDRPVVVQHSRLDSRQAENALLTTIAFPGD